MVSILVSVGVLFWFRFAFDLAPIWVHFLVFTWGVLGFFVGSICVLFGCHFWALCWVRFGFFLGLTCMLLGFRFVIYLGFTWVMVSFHYGFIRFLFGFDACFELGFVLYPCGVLCWFLCLYLFC